MTKLIFLRLSWIALIGAWLWFELILRWMKRNPTYSQQVRDHEAPYPWFFNVWGVLFILQIPATAYLIYYYISKAVT